ncbi:MAG: hypothetical protein KY461_04545 [Actinobacteria bacterium]|nr:hypothetical protein [Actinomycetota bacterium]
MSVRIPTLLLALVLALAACSRTPDDATAEPAPSPGDPSPTTPDPSGSPADGSFAMDWHAPFELTLPNGWTVRDCAGDRTDACVDADGEFLGDLELLTGYPLTEDQAAAEPAAVLSGLAHDFLAHFEEDRAAGCPGFTFVADEVRDAPVGGQPGKRASFSLRDADGAVVERVINHFTLQDGTYAIVNTDAYVTEGGCLGPSETDASFVPSGLATLEPFLDRLVAETDLTTASP